MNYRLDKYGNIAKSDCTHNYPEDGKRYPLMLPIILKNQYTCTYKLFYNPKYAEEVK